LAGDYTVTLEATNSFLCTTTAEQTLSVYGEPEASFEADSVGCVVADLNITNTSLNADYAEWYFSDGYFSNEWEPQRALTDTGTYGVTLIVGNGSGCTDTLMEPAFLRVFPSPVAGMSFEELPQERTITFQFMDESSEDAILFGWDFDDGNQSTLENPRNRYLSSFDKEVIHWVENEFGCKDTVIAFIDLDTLGQLYIPNILEPENFSQPEQNLFFPKGIGLTDYHIAVYARSGQLIWESSALDDEGIPTEAWDGTYQGKMMPPATYVWRVHEARFFGGKPWLGMADENGRLQKSGFLYLVR
jgi:hypothetical protein